MSGHLSKTLTRPRTIVCCLLLLVAGACRQAAQEREEDASTVAFEGVTLVAMTGPEIQPNYTVVVEGDRIVGVGPAGQVAVSESATRVDGKGKFLLPGLAEMHGHIPSPAEPQEWIEDALFLYLAGGVTTVRGMLGHPGQLALREKANSGSIAAPNLYLAGPSFNGNSIGSPQEAVQKVRQQKSEGWDLLKIHPGLTREEYDAMSSTASEVGIQFGGHIPEQVGLEHALKSGQVTIDHLDGYIEYLKGDQGPLSEESLAEVARMTREAGAWVVPTMALWETILGVGDLEAQRNFEELKYVPAAMATRWEENTRQRQEDTTDLAARRQVAENRKLLLGALQRGGVRILMGTDAPQLFSVPGFSLVRELPEMAASGMTPYQILLSGTRNVGEYFREKDRFGTIEPGSRADLLLLDANPLQDISNVFRQSGVMVRGRWIPRAEISARLDRIASRYQR